MAIETTPFLGLPQWKFEDKPSYLVEMNDAYAKIDAGYRTIQVASEGAQTAAEGASAKAEQALTQSQANAGQIVQLGQDITQLEADFINSHYISTVDLAFNPNTKLSQVPVKFAATLDYNEYCAAILVYLNLPSGTYNAENFAIELGTVTGFPNYVVYKSITGNSNISSLSSANNMAVAFAVTLENGKILLKTGGNMVLVNDTLFLFQLTMPVHTMTGARNTLIDNCVYITKELKPLDNH